MDSLPGNRKVVADIDTIISAQAQLTAVNSPFPRFPLHP